MKVPNLPITVFDLRAERPPRRQLEISCHITNPASFDICILDVWIEVKAFNGLRLAECNMGRS